MMRTTGQQFAVDRDATPFAADFLFVVHAVAPLVADAPALGASRRHRRRYRRGRLRREELAANARQQQEDQQAREKHGERHRHADTGCEHGGLHAVGVDIGGFRRRPAQDARDVVGEAEQAEDQKIRPGPAVATQEKDARQQGERRPTDDQQSFQDIRVLRALPGQDHQARDQADRRGQPADQDRDPAQRGDDGGTGRQGSHARMVQRRRFVVTTKPAAVATHAPWRGDHPTPDMVFRRPGRPSPAWPSSIPGRWSSIRRRPSNSRCGA